MMRAATLTLCLLALPLAGCSDGGADPTDVVTLDSARQAEDPVVVEEVPQEGGVAGVVVDAAYRPIAGATVSIPGLDRQRTTDRAGAFGFGGLPAGGLFVRAEHPDYVPGGGETMVVRGEIARLTIALRPAMREPAVQVRSFDGFADVSTAFGSRFTGCAGCEFTLAMPDGVEALVLEGASERTAAVVGNRSFFWDLTTADGTPLGGGTVEDPFRIQFDGESPVLDEVSLLLRIEPADMVPEPNVAFEVFVATFHNGADPDQWSVLEGRA